MLSPVQSLWVGNKLSELEILSIKSFKNSDILSSSILMEKLKEYPEEQL